MRKRDSPATYAIFPCALQHQPDSVTQQDGENPTRLVQGFSALVRPDAALAYAVVIEANVAVAGVVPAKFTEEARSCRSHRWDKTRQGANPRVQRID
jgi:hypothetical protein